MGEASRKTETPMPIAAPSLRASGTDQDSLRYLPAMERLVSVVQELSTARTLEDVMFITRTAARELTGSDGAAFVLRDGTYCHYADESALSPLWKGRRFPMSTCISGWAMMHKESVVIPDVFVDPRIPIDVYRATFVKSLVMVPIRKADPIGAIGTYWAKTHVAPVEQVKLLQALADSTSMALQNVQLYSELERRIARAEDSVRARDEFLSIAAHELRTPLTALQLQLQHLERSERVVVREEEKNHDGLQRALRSTRRLGMLVEDLLDVSRLMMGRVTLDPEPVDPDELVRDVVDRFSEQAQASECPVSVVVRSAGWAMWDRSRVEQVLGNLISNAMKYGAGKPVDVELEADADFVRFSVHDQGIGIGADDVQRIFERFERAVSVQHYGGLGLGLYIARQIVVAHGGTIRVSEEDRRQGSTFVVELPRRLLDGLAAADPAGALAEAKTNTA